MNYKRLLIFGNTGAGKTHLANYLENNFAIPIVSLDNIYWKNSHFIRARSSKWASNRVLEISIKNSWIIEGTYSHLIKLSIERATSIIWLDIPITECVENIRNSEKSINQNTLLRAEQYDTREAGSSRSSHKDIYDNFRRDKLRITSRKDLALLMNTGCTQC